MPDPATIHRDSVAAPAPLRASARVGWSLFAIALLVLLAASLRDIAAPWEPSLRGGNAAAYSDTAVAHTLHYGLGVTLGTPAFVTETEQGLERNVNWHHPPGYWLWLALPASLFGNTPTVLRAGHLVLFLPSLLALFLLIRRVHGPVAAGCAAVLFATCPLVAYFGPMVVQDGVTLSFGLFTAWLFQRHLDRPSRASWWAVAIAFFATCSVDLDGYWFGPTLFVMALGHHERRRAVLAVVALFPVSLLAFATTTIHYGFVMDGPLDYLRQLFGTLNSKGKSRAPGELAERLGVAMHELWIVHRNLPTLGLAILGIVLAPFGGPTLRRLALTGVALVVPGLLNYVAMLEHALAHPFWSLVGFGGLGILAAVAPVAALELTSRGSWRTVLGASVLTGALGTAVFGTIGTHEIIGRYPALPPNGTAELMAKALPALDRCTTTITSAPSTTQIQYGHTTVFFAIDTAEKMRALLTLARAKGLHGWIGVVLRPSDRDGDLPKYLDTLAPRQDVEGALVYRLLM